MGKQVLSRQALYDLIWSEPVSKIAPRYGISDVGLSKLCRRADIPLPPRGYWAQMQHGKKVSRPKLKPAPDSSSEDLTIWASEHRPLSAAATQLDPIIARAVEAEALEENRIVVTDKITGRYADVVRYRDNSSHRVPLTASNAKPDAIEKRRLRILDALVRAVKKRKGTVEAGRGGLAVSLFGSEFSVSCSEPMRLKRVPLTKEQLRNRSQWDRRDHETVRERSGVLRIRIQGADRNRDVVDAPDAPLENRLNDVMVFMLKQCITVAERGRRAEAARIAAAEEAQRRYEAEMRQWQIQEDRRRERERVAALLAECENWRKAEDSVRRRRETAGNASGDWVSWAILAASRLDLL